MNRGRCFLTMNRQAAVNKCQNAAGIPVCLMTYSHHAMRTECDAMTDTTTACGGLRAQSPECQRHQYHRLSIPRHVV